MRGNCDQAAFSLASMMRGPADWMMDLVDERNHADAHALLAYCAEAACAFIRLMAGTGADMVSNGDSPAGPDLISPAMYAAFAQPYEHRIVEQAHALGLPYALHICGNTTKILEGMLATGADALELDYKTDARSARDAMKGRAVFIGNIDPSSVLALGTPALVEATDPGAPRGLRRDAWVHPERGLRHPGRDAPGQPPGHDRRGPRFRNPGLAPRLIRAGRSPGETDTVPVDRTKPGRGRPLSGRSRLTRS